MQNLLRRNLCSSGAPILCPSSPSTLLPSSSLPLIPLLGFNQNTHKFTSYPLRFNKTLMPPSTATAFTTTLSGGGWNPMISVGCNSSSSSSSSGFSAFNRCRICRCSIETSGNNNRPWVVFKETSSGSGSGSRLAWFRTFSSSSGFDDKGVLNSVKNSEDEGVGGGDKGVVVSEGKNVAKLSRRQRGLLGGGGSGNTPALLAGNPDLLRIPGVGPRNLRKLVDNGIGGVDELKKIYKDKFYGKSNQKMVEFLQSSVGIIHRNHAESITTFIEESVNEEMKDDGPKPAQKKRLTFCVEGNISVGKTTFLKRIANETLELQDLVEIVPEPIDKWQDIGPDHFNILDAFYSEPQRYAYTFQNYVFVTRVMQEKESSSGIKPLRLMERSVFSDRMVFVRAVHEANWMNEMEISIYDSWFDPVVSSLPGLVPDGFIYLRASPDTCHKRMMLRKREEEGGVSLEYLRGLHEKHESWLLPFESGNHGVLSVSKLPLHMDNSLHPDIRDHVFYLEGNHMHSSIQKVPALVLDCEPNIDFSKDIEAKQQYARQVAKFFEFVKKAQEVPAKGNESQVLLPHDGGLFGKSFPDSLKTLDFKRAMSLMSTPSG